MNIETKNRILELISQLNTYRDSYYNNNISQVSDKEYDALYDELVSLEDESGIIYSNSPTQSVGYEVKSQLVKVTHQYPLLSLDKTKELTELQTFIGTQPYVIMHKLDGLTCCLTYDNGKLVRAETRGNGEVGEDITHNARMMVGVPLEIPYSQPLVVSGEAIITYDIFNEINSNIETEEEKYATPRNLASGTVRQLDNQVCQERKVKFIAWDVNNNIHTPTLSKTLTFLDELGFITVTRLVGNTNSVPSERELEKAINTLKTQADKSFIPVDGMVIKYDDIAFGKSLGRTAHHFKNGIAYKFYDEEVETTLVDIEWTMGRTGILTPVAVFEPVELDGTTVTRASVHNLNILSKLHLHIGDRITVYKANQIIPQIKHNLSDTHNSEEVQYPKTCPFCQQTLRLGIENNTVTVNCHNINCPERLKSRLSYFVSKPCMDIAGLSESTIEKFIKQGWLTKKVDIFNLKNHKQELLTLEGFGEKSINNLLQAIEKAKTTTFERFICSLEVDGIGTTTAKQLAQECKTPDGLFTISEEQLMSINGWGETTVSDFIYTRARDEEEWKELLSYLNIGEAETSEVISDVLTDITFVITGTLECFTNRDALVKDITSRGGKVVSSVNKKTTYLINNDITSNSSKNKKAKELGIPIISEQEYIELAHSY